MKHFSIKKYPIKPNFKGHLRLWNAAKCKALLDEQCLFNDLQSHVGDNIEEQKNNFEQPEERVKDYVEGFTGNGKPFVLRTIHQIRPMNSL